MFGFNNKDNNKIIQEAKQLSMENERGYIRNAMIGTFGTSDPQKIDKIWREFMPEVTNAILNTENYVVSNNKGINVVHEDLIEIYKSLKEQNEEILKQNEEMQRRNKELQEKYNALVERMAGYIERENGKGR